MISALLEIILTADEKHQRARIHPFHFNTRIDWLEVECYWRKNLHRKKTSKQSMQFFHKRLIVKYASNMKYVLYIVSLFVFSF